MIHFDVWIVLPDGGTALAGEIICGEADSAGSDVEPAVALAWELGDPVIGAIGERGFGPGAAKRTSGEEQWAKIVQAT